MAYTSSQVVQAVPTGINSALVLIARTTFTAATTLTMANVFSSTYDNYLVLVTQLAASETSGEARVNLGTSSTRDQGSNYNLQLCATNNQSFTGTRYTSNDYFLFLGSYVGTNPRNSLGITLYAPNKAANTSVTAVNFGHTTAINTETGAGWLNTSTQYTDFFLTTNSGSVTHTATITVYGYTNS